MKAVKCWNIYLVINILFLLPTFIGGVINYQFYDLIPKDYWLILLTYCVFRITYIHLLACLMLLIWLIVTFKKCDCKKAAVICMCLTALCSVFNVLWVINGLPYTIQ